MKTLNNTKKISPTLKKLRQTWRFSKFSTGTGLRRISLLLMITFSIGCSKNDDNPITPMPNIIGIVPQSGPKTTIVTISGNNFGTEASKVKVFFNDKEGAVQSVSGTQITVTVPAKANTGIVKVMVDDFEVSGPSFTYIISDIQVTTIAGNDPFGFVDGPSSAAKFQSPQGVVVDGSGNVYVADAGNNRIRKIAGDVVSTVTGSTGGFVNGPVATAQFKEPGAITVDALGNLYVTEIEENKIRKITPGGIVSTFAGSGLEDFGDGVGENAHFFHPSGMAVDVSGNVYVADGANNKIRKITPDGVVSTIAGSTYGFMDGTGTNARFKAPRGVAVDVSGNIYVADSFNHRIRKITPEGAVSTLAGSDEGFVDQVGVNAKFNRPTGVAVDVSGNVYVADHLNNRIRKITPNGTVSTLAGSVLGFMDGTGATALFNKPNGIAVDALDNVYVADVVNHRIRKISQE